MKCFIIHNFIIIEEQFVVLLLLKIVHVYCKQEDTLENLLKIEVVAFSYRDWCVNYVQFDIVHK